MKKIKTYFVFAFAAFFAQLNMNTQAQEAFFFGPAASVNVSDSVVLRLNDYVGDTIQWQQSYDRLFWTNIPGAVHDTLLFVADTTTYFRARVIAGDCDPFISDTTMISVYRLTPEVFKVDDYALNLVSDSVQLENGIYIYEDDVSGLIEIGDVIISNEGFGYMRKVTNLNTQNNQTVIETEQALLTEVVEQLQILDSLVITMPGSEKAFINGIPVPIKEFYMIPGAKFNKDRGGINLGGINFTVEVENSQNETGIVTARITDGHVAFNPIFTRELDISWLPPRVNRLSLAAGGELDFDMEAFVESTIQINFVDENIRIIYALIGPIPLGPVPMFIECSIEAGFEAGLELSGKVSFGFESDFNVIFGAEYVRTNTPSWSPIWNTGGSFNHKPLEVDIYAGARAKFEVGPRFDATIAGVVGPYLSALPYLEGTLGVSMPNWMFELNTGIEAKLGFEVGIFGITLEDYYTTLAGYDWLIWETSGTFNPQIPAAAFTATPTSGNAPLTVSYTDQSTNNPTSWDWYFGDGNASTMQNPVHTYEHAGNYTVTLIASNSHGNDWEEKYNYISVTIGSQPCPGTPTVTDIDGNVYNTVLIGGQCWMARNLNTTRAPAGNNITRYCYDNNTTNCELYGGLYSWHTVMNGAGSSNSNPSGVQGICPTGWHVPSIAEWTQLDGYVFIQGFPNSVGNVLKSCRQVNSPLGGDCNTTEHPRWNSHGTQFGFDVFGFSGLPGGCRFTDGDFVFVGDVGAWWSSMEGYNADFAQGFSMSYESGLVNWYDNYKSTGFSVRCLRDEVRTED